MTINQILLIFLTAAFTALGAWLGKKITAFLDKHIENKEVRDVIVNMISKIKDVVKAGYQTYIGALKDQNLFDKAAQENALNKAVESVMVSMPDTTKELIAANFGDVKQWVVDKIEAYLYDLKNKPDDAEKVA